MLVAGNGWSGSLSAYRDHASLNYIRADHASVAYSNLSIMELHIEFKLAPVEAD